MTSPQDPTAERPDEQTGPPPPDGFAPPLPNHPVPPQTDATEGPLAPVPGPDAYDDQLIEGHVYDGIQEYDNPMPGWWLWLFYATIAYSIYYVVALHGLGWIDDYDDTLAAQTAEVEADRAAFAAANPTGPPPDEVLLSAIRDETQVQAGAATFATVCAACHGPQGQGLIGPNLADAYWIHGARPTEIYAVLQHGVAEKGMPAWEKVLSADDLTHLVAYIGSIQGTEPPNAKPPQGEREGGPTKATDPDGPDAVLVPAD